jgi:hypothetical protein
MAILRKPNRDKTSRGLLQRFGFRKSTILRESAVEGVVSEAIETIQREDENVKYIIADTASPIIIERSDLIDGQTVIGVRTAGAVTVKLPLGAKENQIIAVTDERGTADADPITVQIA